MRAIWDIESKLVGLLYTFTVMWDSEAITSTSVYDININKAEVFSWNQQIV